MKLMIQQKTLLGALDRGCLAALSEEAQSDTSLLSLLLKAVKIKIEEDKLTVESATKLVTSRFVIAFDKNDKNSEIVCKEIGEILVPAKELCDWVSRQKDSKLAIGLKVLDNPEIINPQSSEADGAAVKGIKRNGTVQIVSKDEYGTGSKWTLDCYAPDQLNESAVEIPAVAQFTIPAKQLGEAFKSIVFATMPKDYKHLMDSISIHKYNDKLYLMACDTARAAVYEASEAKDVVLESKILVPANFLSSMIKMADEASDVSFYLNEKNSKVYLVQGDKFLLKLTTADQDGMKKYPPVNLLLDKKYVQFATAVKGSLMSRLITTTLVNETAALFQFKDSKLTIIANSTSGKNPSLCDAALKGNAPEFGVVWNVNHLLDFLRLLKEDEVQLALKEGIDNSSYFIDKSLKLSSLQDPKWAYYVMPQDPVKTKYDTAAK